MRKFEKEFIGSATAAIVCNSKGLILEGDGQ
ncbi:hypothetical protein IGI37_002210 [Enterococcus sp. AZ194]